MSLAASPWEMCAFVDSQSTDVCGHNRSRNLLRSAGRAQTMAFLAWR